MRRFCMVLLFIPLLSVAAQPEGLAVVADSDGHANLRARPDLKSKVLAKLPNGTPIYCLSDEAGDGCAQFCDARLQTPSEGGFVHHSRLVFPKRSGGFVPLRLRHNGSDGITLSAAGQTIRVTAARFKPNKADFSGIDKQGYTARRYRGHPFYGTDNMIPDEVFVPASITLNGRPVPATQLQGLFHPVYAANPQAGNFWHTWEAYYRPDSRTVYLYASLGADGAPFGVTFVFEKGRFVRRYLWGETI